MLYRSAINISDMENGTITTRVRKYSGVLDKLKPKGEDMASLTLMVEAEPIYQEIHWFANVKTLKKFARAILKELQQL